MGQQIGKTVILQNAKPFLNLRKKSVELLWESFNDIADGFGLTRDEFVEICQVLEKPLRRKRTEMKDLSNLLFDLLDTDKNELVDALEFLTSMALVSGMDVTEKVRFVFMCYDFAENDGLTIDEMTLALKSAVTGVAKLSGDEPPLEVDVERFSEEAFFKAKIAKDKTLPKRKFVEFCETCTEIRSYVSHYDDPKEVTSTHLLGQSDEVLESEESSIPIRSDIQTKMMDPSVGARNVVFLESEKKRLGPDVLQYRRWEDKLDPPTEMPILIHETPTSTLSLEWIHGYQAQNLRNNLMYTSEGDLVWPAASVAVVQNVTEHKQRFYMDCKDKIVCMAMHPSGDIFACGTAGEIPEISIWNTRTMRTLQILRGFHRKGLTHLCFSPDGEQLLSVGADPNHCIAVYEWEKNRIIFDDQCGPENVLATVFRDNVTFVTAVMDDMFFWGPDPVAKYRKRRAHFGRIGQPQPVTCVGTMGASETILVTGTKSGHVYLWIERSCVDAIHAHDGVVTSIAILGTRKFLTAGSKGKIRHWKIAEETLEVGAIFDLNTFKPFNSFVTSLRVGPKQRKYLVGTRGGQAFEMSAKDGTNMHRGAVIGGHSHGELHGMDVHPERQECCTVGDDGRLQIWDLNTRMLVKSTRLKSGGRCVAYSPEGSFIACGLGVGKPGPYEGMFSVYNESDLTLIFEAKDAKRMITDIRFSPNGLILAAASMDRTICIYNVMDSEFFAKAKCKGHMRPIAHIDFDVEGQRLRSSSIPDGNELFFWDAETGEVIKSGAVRDVSWETSRVPYTWGGKGAFDVLADKTVLQCSERSKDGKVLVVGDNYGRLRMMASPQPEWGAPAKYATGHQTEIVNLRFSAKDKFFLSCGEDCNLFQWKYEDGPEAGSRLAVESKAYEPEFDSEDEDTFAEFDKYPRTDKEECALNDDFTKLFDYEDSTGIGSNRFKAVKPWTQEVVPPTRKFREDARPPIDGLSLNWVHGYRTRDMRGTLRYTATGEIVFTVAHVAVVMDRQHRRQRYFTRHTDDIVSMAIDQSKRIVATGQIGRVPTIWVWDASTQTSLARIEGFHRRGISNLAFSNDSTMLASSGLEEEHQFAIWDWKRQKMLACEPRSHRKRVLDLSWSPKDKYVVQVGVDHIQFHHLQGRNIVSKCPEYVKGKRQGIVQPFMCVGWCAENRPVIGTHDGHLYEFDPETNFSIRNIVQAHSSTVNTIYTSFGHGICTGGKDGHVKLFNEDLECSKTFDVGALGTSVKSSVRSVEWDPEDRTLLTGTRGSDIYELSALDGTDVNGGPILAGHSGGELWGLACHPTRSEFVTAGDDMTLRLWEAKNKVCLRSCTLPCMARCCAYHPDGKKIAVGLGADLGRGKHKKSGGFLIISASAMETTHEGKDSKQWITDIKYTPDGNTLAVASHDSRIYIYDVSNGYMMRGVFSKHNAFVTHFDFSSDSAFLQSNCGAFELLFADVSNGSHMPVASVLRDQLWDTQTCPFGWSVQGLWPKAEEVLGTDVHACDRSRSKKLLVSSDAFGALRLHRYPCLVQGSGHKCYQGHSLHVRNVRFSAGDRYVISVGGQDRAVFQWEVNLENDENDALKDDDEEDHNDGVDSDVADMFDDAEDGAARDQDDYVAVKPWLGSIVPPTNAPKKSIQGPDIDRLTLDFAHGYRSQDTRATVAYNHVGNIVYPSAALGVIYKKESHGQRFFSKHRGDVVSLAMDRSGHFVATGEIGKRPSIHIWNAVTASLICSFENFHRHAVVCLQFDKEGKQLVSVGNDENHIVAVWATHSGTWEDGHLKAYGTNGRAKTCFSLFNIPQANFSVLTGGVNHVNFWRLRGRVLTSHRGFFGKKAHVQPVLCGAVIRSHFVCGTSSGHLLVFDQITRTVSRSVKAHSKAINAMNERDTDCGHFLLTGSKDGVVKIWNHNLICQKAFDMNDANPTPRIPSVRSVAINKFGNTILIGTQGAEIYEVSSILATAAVTKSYLLGQGHYGADQLHGLAPHPLDADIFATTGDDATLRVWSISKRKILRELALESVSRCVCWSPDGKVLGVGLGGLTRRGRSKKAGAFLVIDASSLTVMFEGRDSRESITDIKFSPDGRIFACASRDSKIYLYDPHDAYMLKAKCEKHSSHITHFDFSANSAYIQSNDGAYELIFYNSADGQQLLSASSVKDEEWHSPTCVLSWSMQGAWPEVYDGNEIHAAHRSNDKKHIAIADAFGQIKVYRYPCLDKRAKFASGFGIASHASNIRWSKDDRYIIVTGGRDRTVLVWRVDKLIEKSSSSSSSSDGGGGDSESSKTKD